MMLCFFFLRGDGNVLVLFLNKRVLYEGTTKN